VGIHPRSGTSGRGGEAFTFLEEPMNNSGFTEDQARAFHRVFMNSFIGFTVVAIIAHILVWMWTPWL
jgi:light-harvesting complex 1 beta chain